MLGNYKDKDDKLFSCGYIKTTRFALVVNTDKDDKLFSCGL